MTIIYFPSGTFNIDSTISLNSNDKDIVFQGNGTSATILEFRVGRNNVCFQIAGAVIGDKVKLDSGMSKGTNIISVKNVSNFSVGDWIHYFEYYFPMEKVGDWPKCVGQVTRIDSINGNKFIIQEKTSKSYSSQYGPYVEKIDPIKNIGIEKLKIKRLDTGKSDKKKNGSNVNFSYAINCWIKGVEFTNTCKHHIIASFSAHLEISGCYFNSANSHNDGGYGYGVCLQRSTNFCLIENNIFRDLRHSMLVQGGANSNAFEYNYSREAYGLVTKPIIPDQPFLPPDICIHGRYPFANIFEENNVEYIKADNEHGANGPFNTFVRNIVYNDDENYLYFISLLESEHSNILGCNNGNANRDPFVYPPLGYEYTPDTDIYGFEMYIDNIPYYPWNHNNSYIAGERPYLLMKDISYYYS